MLGLLLSLAFVLSGWFVLRWRVILKPGDTTVNITRGCVEVQRREASPIGVYPYVLVCRSTVPAGWDLWGWRRGEFTAGFAIYRFPFWPAVLPPLLTRATVRLARQGYWAWRGRCPGCGYARTGLPPGVACPECGEAA